MITFSKENWEKLSAQNKQLHTINECNPCQLTIAEKITEENIIETTGTGTSHIPVVSSSEELIISHPSFLSPCTNLFTNSQPTTQPTLNISQSNSPNFLYVTHPLPFLTLTTMMNH